MEFLVKQDTELPKIIRPFATPMQLAGLSTGRGNIDGEGKEADADRVMPTRRDALRRAVRLPFVPPVVMTFSAAVAGTAASRQSCYPQGHRCPGQEACCPGSTCTMGVCRPWGSHGRPRVPVPR